MNYFKKSHSHKPKKGKGSYTRENPEDWHEEELPDHELADKFEEDETSED